MPDCPFQKARFRLLDEIVLLLGVEHIDLHRQRSTEHVEECADDLLSGFCRGRLKNRGNLDKAFVPSAFANGEARLPQLLLSEQPVLPVEPLVLEAKQPAVFQVGRGHAPAAFEITVEKVLQDPPQGVLGTLPGRIFVLTDSAGFKRILCRVDFLRAPRYKSSNRGDRALGTRWTSRK